MTDAAWMRSFYDDDYLKLWGEFYDPAASAAQVDAIWTVLGLAAGARVLDAPCGFGRLSRPLAERGATVVGIDQSEVLLAEAARAHAGLGIAFVHHDLRAPIDASVGEFDAAINIFSSIGHNSEDDDRAMFANTAARLVRGGRFMVETMHRDVLVARRAAGPVTNERTLSDGTRLIEDARWDPLRGRVDSVWRWSGPAGDGEKRSSLRVYALPEIVRLLELAGLDVVAAYRGCTTEPFTGLGPAGGGRCAIVAIKR